MKNENKTSLRFSYSCYSSLYWLKCSPRHLVGPLWNTGSWTRWALGPILQGSSYVLMLSTKPKLTNYVQFERKWLKCENISKERMSTTSVDFCDSTYLYYSYMRLIHFHNFAFKSLHPLLSQYRPFSTVMIYNTTQTFYQYQQRSWNAMDMQDHCTAWYWGVHVRSMCSKNSSHSIQMSSVVTSTVLSNPECIL